MIAQGTLDRLREELRQLLPEDLTPGEGQAVILGVGNPYRRDDGVGPAAVEALRQWDELPAGVELRAISGESLELLAAWEGAELVVVIDAAVTGSPPGTVTRVELDGGSLPADGAEMDGMILTIEGQSTHGLGVGEAIELGRLLGRLPPRLVILAVEGRDFGWGPGAQAS